jgi:hypothetical protein
MAAQPIPPAKKLSLPSIPDGCDHDHFIGLNMRRPAPRIVTSPQADPHPRDTTPNDPAQGR